MISSSGRNHPTMPLACTDFDIALSMLPVFCTQHHCSQALPLWLTRNGAYLDIPGVGETVPTMWTVLLAESGEAKPLASDQTKS